MKSIDHPKSHNGTQQTNHYLKLFAMIVLSYISMFILMYAMVDSMPNVVININQFYMAGLMAAPMVVIELVLMWGMYPNKKLNIGIISASMIVLIVCFMAIRQQTGVGDRQFIKSMIPHHAAAILMVEKASITDPDLKALADGIISTQQQEIERMKAKLQELEKQMK